MNLISRLTVVVVLCLIAIALPSLPAQAQCGGPVIELSPRYGLPGTRVTIYGHYFTGDKLVDIYYDGTLVVTNVRTGSGGDLAYTLNIPEGCGGPYQVLADAEYARVDTYFTVKPGLTVTPDNGPSGMTVAVTGQGFANSEGSIELLYYLNDSYETVASDIQASAKGSWQTSFSVPACTRGQHKIDARGAVSRLYDVQDAIFTVTAGISLDRSWGIVADNVRMTGGRFAPYEKGIQILFGGQPVATDVRANSRGEWEASFGVPEMPGGEYSVTAEGDQTRQADAGELSFEIKPQMALSASEGHVGMNLTVTGHGFAAGEDVDIRYDGNQVTTVGSSDQGSFEASFAVPDSRYGEHLVIAQDGAGNAFTAVFTMESNHPDAPPLISPSNSGRVGLIGKVAPTLRWSEVSDDSGVHYSLQIATSANVAATGEFVDPIVAVSGLVETSYTLNTTEALPSGSYYWIVQAVDGADNESPWTAPRSLRIGLLPLWAFILIIVAVVVLIGALIRAFIRRRAIYDDRW